MQRATGFTLIEALLSVAIIAILAGLSLPLYRSYAAQNDLSLAAQYISTSLRRAETYAQNGAQDSPWGVSVQTSQVVVYKGDSYENRDRTYDEATTLGSITSVSGVTDVSFARLTTEPSATGAISITSTNNETRTMSVNEQGTISYE